MITGYHISPQGIFNSHGDMCQGAEYPFDYLDWLIGDHPEAETKVFYDLNGSVGSLCRLLQLDRREAERLSMNKKWYSAPFRMTYYPGRFFSVDKGFGLWHPYANF